MARPLKKIDWKTVKDLCGIHCTGEEIANILSISYDCLNDACHREKKLSFPDYYKKHSSGGKASLRRRQFKAAIEDGNVTMMVWLGKQYLGQSDKQETNVSIRPEEIGQAFDEAWSDLENAEGSSE